MRPVPRDLAALRLRAEAAARAEDWPTLSSYADDLRDRDLEWWPHLWAPLTAVAVHHAGGDPAPLLEEAVAGGFRQPEALELDRLLGGLADWPTWSSRMAEPARPPAAEVTCWPTVTYGPELVLDRLPADREAELRARLPRPESGAWATCRALLEWVTTRWEHANDHVDSRDAVEVLDRAAAGERCRRHSTPSPSRPAGSTCARATSTSVSVADMSSARRGSTTWPAGWCSTGRTERGGALPTIPSVSASSRAWRERALTGPRCARPRAR